MKAFIKSIIVATVITVSVHPLQADPAIVVNFENAESLSSDKLTSLLIGKLKFWDGGNEVIIAVLKKDGDTLAALETYTKMNESRFKSHWQRLAFSGRGTMPKQFSDPAALVAFVSINKGAIGILGTSADLSAVKQVN